MLKKHFLIYNNVSNNLTTHYFPYKRTISYVDV